MRKILLLLIIIAFPFADNAIGQISKGSIFLGGDVGAHTQKTKSDAVVTNKTTGIYVMPVFGKAIRENLVFGVNAGFSITDAKNPATNGQQKTEGYNAGLFLRKYKNIGTSNFYVFIQGGVGANYQLQEQEGGYMTYDKAKRTTIGLTAYPGVSYAINKKFHLESGLNNLIMINYYHENHETGSPVTTYKTNGFSIASSLNNSSSLYLGFRVLIGK